VAHPPEVSDSRAFIELVERDALRTGELAWAIVLHETSELIGAASCHPDGHKASFGYVLAKHAWGKGLATEAASEIVGWLE
jgi:ribosomal-protein-alanine N-acetyltransferase